ncbi:MAG: four helix bundle protein, partial [Patescibacteria group bacterium]
ILHKKTELYKKLNKISQKVSKRDKFGIFLKIENACLETLSLSVRAAFTPRIEKSKFISHLRVVTELLKNLIRITYEVNIIDQKIYLDLQTDLQEISKMGWGWLDFIRKQ